MASREVRRLERRNEQLEAEIARLEAGAKMEREASASSLARLKRELTDSAEARGRLQAELEEERAAREDLERYMRRKLEEAEEGRLAEASRLQREIDRMYALQAACLAAGTYKGREMLYLDSLRARPARFKPSLEVSYEASLERAATRSGVSWRDGDECERTTKEVLARIRSSPGEVTDAV